MVSYNFEKGEAATQRLCFKRCKSHGKKYNERTIENSLKICPRELQREEGTHAIMPSKFHRTIIRILISQDFKLKEKYLFHK